MYTFNTTASGTIEVFQNGQRISTTTPTLASQLYGYSPTSTPQTPTATAAPITSAISAPSLGTPVVLGSGQTVYVDQAGTFKDASGNVVSNTTVSNSTASVAPTSSAQKGAPLTFVSDDGSSIKTDGKGNFYYAGSGQQIGPGSPAFSSASAAYGRLIAAPQSSAPAVSPSRVVPNQTTPYDATLETFLSTSALPQDLKAMIQAAYGAISTNDQAKANQLISAFNAASQYSDPYFKAQIRIATDALQRGVQGQEGDLSFKEQQLQNALQDTSSNIAASKDYLSFQHNQELNQLARNYQQELDSTQNDLASRGLTSSSIRSRSEGILKDNYNGMVESNNKTFAFQTGQQNRQLGTAQRDTAAQLAYYQDLAARNKLDLLRKTEEQVGSTNLSGYSNLLGNIGGQIPQNQVKDALSFASNFVF